MREFRETYRRDPTAEEMKIAEGECKESVKLFKPTINIWLSDNDAQCAIWFADYYYEQVECMYHP